MHTVLLSIGGVVGALAAVKAIAWLLVRRSVETLDFQGPVRAIEVSLGAGEVTVRGNNRSGARVRRTVRHRLRRPKITEQVDDGVLHLRVSSGVVRYEIDVPTATSVVVWGKSASATVIGVTGPVELRASAGSLEGRALSARWVRAITSSGSIRLSFDAAPDVVDVSTEAGSVDLRLPEGPYDVDANSPLGGSKVGVRCDAAAHRRVRAHTAAGSVRIQNR